MSNNSVKNIAEKWNISERHVQRLCRMGLVEGAEKIGRDWIIPENAEKPTDKRTKQGKLEKEGFSMPRKSPFLEMTTLYHTAGKAEECAEYLSNNPDAKLLFEAEIAYSRGKIEEVYESAKYFIDNHSDFYSTIAGGMLLARAAMWNGDIYVWNEAKKNICNAPCKNESDTEILALSLAAVNSAIRDIADFPDWFFRGNFEILPADAHPAARVFYIKYLMIYAQELAMGKIKLKDVTGLGLMRTIPYLAEPMISQAVVEKTIIVELYLRLIVAISYHNIGDRERAINHLDKAISIALPDKLYGILAEHRRQLDFLLDERLELVDKDALKEVKKAHKKLLDGWYKLHNTILEKNVLGTLTIREREVARLVAFGLSDKDISKRLNIQLSSVKSIVAMVKNKTGAKKRSDLGAYI